MASLDLQEQEQLDNLKAFWAKWGTLINGVLVLALGAFAAWNLWQWHQRTQGAKASTVYDGVEAAIESKDSAKAARLWAQMQIDFPRATYTAQAALLVAQAQAGAGQLSEATKTLEWASQEGQPQELQELAALRLAGVELEAKRYAQAEAALALVKSPAYAALVADRRGDLAQLQGQADKAVGHYKTAFTTMDAQQPYRNLIEAKLTALGVDTSTLVAVEVK